MRSRSSCRRLLPVGLAALLLVAPGCGSPGGGEQSEAEALAGLVAEAPDRAVGEQPARGYFADGAVPPPGVRRRFGRYSFEAAGPPAVRGDRAAVRVRLRTADGADAGEVSWTFVKQAGEWRLQDAPLP